MFGVVSLLLASSAVNVGAFTPNSNYKRTNVVSQRPSSAIFLQSNLRIPILDLLDETTTSTATKDDESSTVTPLPSSHLPPEIATPFLYGMQVDRPVHKLLLDEATTIVDAGKVQAVYGHLAWKPSSGSLIGAIGCTAQILVNAPTTEVLSLSIAQDLEALSLETPVGGDDDTSSKVPPPPSETPSRMILCRGGFRFVVKEVVKSIPYPVAIVDEIQDDAEMDDSDMFAAFSRGSDDDDDDDDDDTAKYSSMSGAELLQRTMLGVQAIISQKVAECAAKQLSPLEKQILESSGVTVDPNAIEQARVEEMAAVFDVFQEALVDEILPRERKFAVAIMAAELADMNNSVRQQLLLTRDAEERLRIVLKELDEIVGMQKARKFAAQITGRLDEDERDLKVGKPQLPPWAKAIVKGTKVEYFWNEEHGWCAAEIISDPVTVVDEILLTVRFEDGEVHTLPLSAEDKVRWRPRQN
jgi:hypothetical protein